NSGANSNGVVLNPAGSGSVIAVLNRVVIENNGSIGIQGDGASSTGSINMTVSDRVVANHPQYGILSRSDPAMAVTSVMVRSSTITGSAVVGLAAVGNNAVLRVTRSTVTANAIGLQSGTGGVLSSYGDNYVDGNTTDGVPTSTIPLK